LAGLEGRAKHLVEKKILHNRTAAQEGKHVLGPVLDSFNNMVDNLICEKCHRTTKRQCLSPWLAQPCEVRSAGGRIRDSTKLARQQAAIDKLAAAGHKVEIKDDVATCQVCGNTKPMRRYTEMLKAPCQPASR